MKKIRPKHPGKILTEDFMKPRGFPPRMVAFLMIVPEKRIVEIIRGERAINVDTAERLAGLFRTTTPEYWLQLQLDYDLWQAEETLRNLNTVLAKQRPKSGP